MKKIIYTVITFSLLLTIGCTKKIEDAYKNPNFPDRVPVAKLLPTIENALITGLQFDSRYLGSYTQNWCVNASATNQWDRQGYIPASDAGGQMWRTVYFDMGNNMKNMRKWALEENKPRFAACQLALEAIAFLQLTDYHGEIVYKDAFSFQGASYDKQEDVYKSVRLTAHQAIAELNAAASGSDAAEFTAADVSLCQGNLDKWKKLCYGVLARSFAHLTNKANFNSSLADSVITYANLSVQSYLDNVDYSYIFNGTGSVAATGNFFGEFRGNVQSFIQTKFMADLMTGRNPMFQAPFFATDSIDPRAYYLLSRCEDTLPLSNRNFYGLLPNVVSGGITTTGQRPRNFWNSNAGTFPVTAGTDPQSKFIFKNNSPIPIITSTEMEFIKSEAYFRKGDKVNAHLAYLKGIAEHFNMLEAFYTLGGTRAGWITNITNIPIALASDGIQGANRRINTTIRNAYIFNPRIGLSSSTITLSHIMLQKYIAMFGHNMLETWTDLRRYHYSDIDPSTGSQVYNQFTPPVGAVLFPDNNNKLVYRVRPRYNSEYVWNRPALNLINGLAGDYHTDQSWFSLP